MKRTPLLLTLVFFLTVAGGITLYQKYFNKHETSVWDLFPKQTILVYEIDDCTDCVAPEERNIVGKILKSILLDFSDSTKKALDVLRTQKKGDAISLHVTGKDDFDVVYYFSSNQTKQFESATEFWKEGKKVKFFERELNGNKIQEFSIGGRVFSCVKLDRIWVGSFTPFLIEDVIRTFSSDDETKFSTEMREMYALPKIKGDRGNFYIHLVNVVSWLKVFPEKDNEIPAIGFASCLDVRQAENSITLNGLSLIKDESKSMLSFFKDQSPVQFLQKQYISNRTIFATNYGINDGVSLYRDLGLSKNKNTQDTLASLVKIDFEGLFSSFGKELSLCFLESKNKSVSKIILFETEKPQAWLDAFDRLSKAVEKDDTVFYEKFSTYEIREIEINNLPGKFFSPLTSGFSQTYYTWIGKTIIMSEELEEIKQFVDDIDQENVWGKSISFNKFLESTLLESNMSFYVNTPLVWNVLSNKLNPRWSKFILTNQYLLKSLKLGAIQFSHLNESFYTNITLTYSNEVAERNDHSVKKSERLVASLNSTIANGPFVVKSHVNKKDEVLVQDSLHNLYHLSGDGKILWELALEGSIIGGIKQVDFYKNGKLQFFLATSRKLYVIDRLGNFVDPFPVEIKVKDAEFVSTVDYDNSKKYRFLVADKLGKLWMYDKEVQNLEGWKPRNIENGLFTTARHHRIRGKDYILAIRKDGWAHLMNRKGEYVNGFPLNLDARPAGDYYVELGNSAATTNFVCVSRDGFRVKFNLEGKLLSRETLVKPSFETQFSLISEQGGKAYLIKRQDAKQLTLLNEEGNELLSNNFIGTNASEILYYDFGAGKEYITVTDLAQELSFLYTGKGDLLSVTPIEGKSIVLRPSDSDFPTTYVVDGNTLTIQ